MHLKGLVRRAFEIDGDRGPVRAATAYHHVVCGGLRGRMHCLHRQGEVFLLQHLAPNQRQGNADVAVIAVRLQVVRGDTDADAVHAGPRQPASFGEGEDIRSVVAADMQHDSGLGALGFPIPVLRMDQDVVGGRFRHHGNSGCAAISQRGRSAGFLASFRISVRAFSNRYRPAQPQRLRRCAHFFQIVGSNALITV